VKRLADRHHTGPQLLGEIPDGEGLAGLESSVTQACAKLGVHLLLQGVAGDRGERVGR